MYTRQGRIFVGVHVGVPSSPESVQDTWALGVKKARSEGGCVEEIRFGTAKSVKHGGLSTAGKMSALEI